MRSLLIVLLALLVPCVGACSRSSRPLLLDTSNLGRLESIALQHALADERVIDRVGCNPAVTRTASARYAATSGVLLWKPDTGRIEDSYFLFGDKGSGTLDVSLRGRGRVWSIQKLDFAGQSLLNNNEGRQGSR